jgi:hypothetical protein
VESPNTGTTNRGATSMSTLATNAITDASGGNTATINSYTPTESNMAGRNLIINGAMQVAQRGASFTGVGGSSVTYTVDRWAVREATDAVVDVSQATDSPSTDLFKYCLKLDVTTADASIAAGQVCTVQHRIEAQDLVRAGFGTANAKQLTISFWHKHTKTGTYSVGFTNHNGTRGYPAEYTQSVSDTWEKSTVTFTADTTGTWATDNTLGMIVYFSVAAGTDFYATVGAWTGANDFASANQVNALDSTSNSFRITGVQLEAGSVATPFEHRQFGQELALCQRYYQKWQNESGGETTGSVGTGTVWTSTNFFCVLQYFVPMRALPDGEKSSTTAITLLCNSAAKQTTNIVFGSYSRNSVEIIGTSSGMGAGQAGFVRFTGASDYIALTAEL